MKTLILVCALAMVTPTFADNPSTPQLTYANTDSKAARIAFLKSDIAEKKQIFQKDWNQAIKTGQNPPSPAFKKQIADEQAELDSLQH